MNFKNLVKRNPLLYKVWFYLYRTRTGDKVRLPQKTDHLYFDGYPRSGNTYFSGLISFVFADTEFTSHLHVIAGIKLALKQGLPVFIIIRKPEDAIISNLFRVTEKKSLKPSQKLVDELAFGYVEYYSYVNSRRDTLNILDFSKVTQEPLAMLKKVAPVLSDSKRSDEKFEEQVKRFDERIKEKEKNKISATSALPNEERKFFKNNHMNLVLSSKHLEKANQLYSTLVQNHSNI
ncbi:MAG: hypothetical protein U5K69_18920 [Balneolaceae bacterium]|nr:hypothetical protein [Balneolaceae bacterium]